MDFCLVKLPDYISNNANDGMHVSSTCGLEGSSNIDVGMQSGIPCPVSPFWEIIIAFSMSTEDYAL